MYCPVGFTRIACRICSTVGDSVCIDHICIYATCGSHSEDAISIILGSGTLLCVCGTLCDSHRIGTRDGDDWGFGIGDRYASTQCIYQQLYLCWCIYIYFRETCYHCIDIVYVASIHTAHTCCSIDILIWRCTSILGIRLDLCYSCILGIRSTATPAST